MCQKDTTEEKQYTEPKRQFFVQCLAKSDVLCAAFFKIRTNTARFNPVYDFCCLMLVVLQYTCTVFFMQCVKILFK